MLSFFQRGILDEILNLIESVSEDFPSFSRKPNIFLVFSEKKYFVLIFFFLGELTVIKTQLNYLFSSHFSLLLLGSVRLFDIILDANTPSKWFIMSFK